MRILVIGKGGREHALVRALQGSLLTTEIHVIPGNPGMRGNVICHDINLKDKENLKEFLRKNSFAFAMIGPELEVAEGLSDFFRECHLPVVAPSQQASQLETSKIFGKMFMEKAGVPTARYSIVESVEEVMDAASQFTPPYILKADGLAAGKGVFICEDLSALKVSAEDLFVRKTLGANGERAILEEALEGWELSYLIMTNGHDFQSFPVGQDHKRIFEGDRGPNTGGMGVVAPIPLDVGLESEIQEKIIRPTLLQMQKEDFLYRGILFVGVMVTAHGPQVLEYNIRFGDPEAQALVPLMEEDFAKVMKSLAEGIVLPVHWRPLYSACVVMAAENYPNPPVTGVSIEGDCFFESSNSYFLHAGTSLDSSRRFVVGGGRVLNAIGIGGSKNEALRAAYEQASHVRWKGLQMRKDIGITS